MLGVWTLLLYLALIYPLGFLWWLAYRRRIHAMEEEGGAARVPPSRFFTSSRFRRNRDRR